MVKVLKEHRENRASRRGNKSPLCMEDWVLILLRYYREYVTYLSIAADVGISESAVCRIVKKAEEVLIKSELFHVPGKKALRSEMSYEVIVVDATETEIERPKKNDSIKRNDVSIDKTSRNDSIQARKSTTV